MNTRRRNFTSTVLCVLPAILALWLLRGAPLATRAAPLLQEEIPACSGESVIEPGAAPCQDIQVLFIIDDSGSMRVNDPIKARFAGVENTIDILGEVYLNALEAQSRSLPAIYVSAVHFARDVDVGTEWVQINPAERATWENDASTAGSRAAIIQALIPDSIRNLVLTNARTTNFINPFRKAVEMYGSAPPTKEDCTNRLVLVFTDGAPDLGAGPLTGTALSNHFVEVKASAAQLKDAFKNKIYVSGLNDETRRLDYWAISQAQWEEVSAGATSGDLLGSLKIVDAVDDSGQKVGKLAVLRDRIQAIIEKNIGLQGESVVGTATIPPYLQFLRVSYFAPNATATLRIYGPDGNQIEVDDETVTLTGAGTPDKVYKILNPPPGEYRFEPSSPGGSIRLLYFYPSLEEPFPLLLENDTFQQFTEGVLKLQVGEALQIRQDVPPRFAAQLSLPGEEPAALDLQMDGGGLEIPILPLQAGGGEVSLDVIIQGQDGAECMLTRGATSFTVAAVTLVASPVDPQVCTPSGMPVSFPIELRNAETNALTSISLPVVWELEALHEKGAAVQAAVIEGGQAGVYEFSLNAEAAGQISADVTASVSHAGATVVLLEETFVFTHLLQDGFYAFELSGVQTPADSLSISFNRWFRRISPKPDDVLLLGRVWFNWFGRQNVRVSGRFYDKDSGESRSGIERYEVGLRRTGSGEVVTSSSDWQEVLDGDAYITFTAPALGAYDVVVSDKGEAAACVLVDPPGAGPHIILINHFWEYLFWILLILLILLILWWLIWRRRKDRDEEPEKEPDHKGPPEPGTPPPAPIEEYPTPEKPTPYAPTPPPDVPIPYAPTPPIPAVDDSARGGGVELPIAADDLEIIDGIGPVIARRLNDAGIYTFKQLADMTPARLREIVGELVQRLADEDYLISQAAELADKKDSGDMEI